MKKKIDLRVIESVNFKLLDRFSYDSRPGEPGYEINYKGGYMTWVSKTEYESTFSNKDHVTFSEALIFATEGYRIKRSIWESEREFIVYQKGYPNGIDCNKQTSEAWSIDEGSAFKCSPYLQKQTSDLDHYMWTPSTEDLMKNDWVILDK